MSKLFQVRWGLTDIFIAILVVILALLGLNSLVLYTNLGEILKVSMSKEVLLVYLVLFQSIVLILPIILVLIVKKRKWSFKELGFSKKGIWEGIPQALAAYLVYIAITLFITLLILYADLHIPGYQLQAPILPIFGDSTLALGLAGVLMIIVAPLTEELFFRGFVLQGLVKDLGAPIAAIATALVFATFHLQFGSFIPIFILGLILSILFLQTRSIWACIWFHVINNSVAFAIQLMIIYEVIPTDF